MYICKIWFTHLKMKINNHLIKLKLKHGCITNTKIIFYHLFYLWEIGNETSNIITKRKLIYTSIQ